jgi:hypothetical protein
MPRYLAATDSSPQQIRRNKNVSCASLSSVVILPKPRAFGNIGILRRIALQALATTRRRGADQLFPERQLVQAEQAADDPEQQHRLEKSARSRSQAAAPRPPKHGAGARQPRSRLSRDEEAGPTLAAGHSRLILNS